MHSILRLFKTSYFSTAHKQPLSHMRAEVVQECLMSVIRDEGLVGMRWGFLTLKYKPKTFTASSLQITAFSVYAPVSFPIRVHLRIRNIHYLVSRRRPTLPIYSTIQTLLCAEQQTTLLNRLEWLLSHLKTLAQQSPKDPRCLR